MNTNLTRRRFLIALIVAALCMLVLRRIDVPLRTSAAPQGIVSFEFAGNSATAQRILATWDAPARVYAAFSLGFDYLFMPAYASALALACQLAREPWRVRSRRLGQWGAGLALAQFGAALFDGVENLGLWRVLTGAAGDAWPRLAAICAAIKFVLIVLGLVYGLIGAGLALESRRHLHRPT